MKRENKPETTLLAMVAVTGRTAEYRKMLMSKEDIFPTPDNLSSSINYDPSTLLEENEWYVITNFSKKKLLPIVTPKSNILIC
jgi:hypothetical protein